MRIRNYEFKLEEITAGDCFICALGYEKRSTYIYEKVKTIIDTDNILGFIFKDYQTYSDMSSEIKRIDSLLKHKEYATYSDYPTVLSTIESFIQNKKQCNDSITVYIDYSSMPRSWYCRIIDRIEGLISLDDRVVFCYTEGKYPLEYESYPSAGISSFSVFSGKASLSPRKRIHMIAIGYDTVRSQATTEILDPERIIVIMACSSKNKEIENSCRIRNAQLIRRAWQTVLLHIDDFEFMISKLRELIKDYIPFGDVILVPDGPKPLVLAMSLIVILLQFNGVTCLHISRNEEYFKPVNVIPTDNIFCFSVSL